MFCWAMSTSGSRSGVPVPTVLMMHGGFSDSRDFEDNLASLRSGYRLLLLDRRGHGRTADVDGPLTLEVMADDAIRFIEAVAVVPWPSSDTARALRWLSGSPRAGRIW